MTPQSCHGCTHYRHSTIYGLACYRTKTFKSGRKLDVQKDWELFPVSPMGFAAEFETHESPDIYEGRADGDHCGPSRIHFKAGEGAYGV